MRFALSDDQSAFRDAVRDLLAKECPPAVVRAAWEAPAGALDRGVWDSLGAMGVLTLLMPEADGGLGLDETFLVPILEECGRAALPHPIVETAMVAAPLLGADAGMVTTNLGGPNLPCAADADTLLLVVGDVLLRAPRDGVDLSPVTTVDRARRAANVVTPELVRQRHTEPVTATQASGVAGHSAEPVRQQHTEPVAATQASGVESAVFVTDDPTTIALAVDRGALGTAAMLVGLGQAMLDLTVGYAKERQQFGVPIGSFQAVKHHLADAALALEFARPAVWRAGWSVAHDEPTRTRDVSMAKAMASDAAELVGRKALQCHGAIGYTVEADLHLYLKRTWALARASGDSAHHTDRVAEALGT